MQVMGGLVEGLWGLAVHPGFQGLACHAMAGTWPASSPPRGANHDAAGNQALPYPAQAPNPRPSLVMPAR